MNEHSFVDKLQAALKPKAHLVWKIHDNYQGGVPDMFVEGDKKDLWIEVKYMKALPRRPETVVDMKEGKMLTMLQRKWLRRREAVRKDTLVVVGCPEGVAIYKNGEWETPQTCKEFKERLYTFPQAIELIGTLL